MASTLNASTSSGLISSGDTSGVLQLQTANTTALTVDGSQNIGIGTTSPVAYSGYGVLALNGTNGAFLEFLRGNTDEMEIYIDSTNNNIRGKTSKPLLLYTNDTERMRIDSSGNLLVGTTSNITGGKVNIAQGSSDGTMYQMMQLTAGSGTGGNEVGQIKRQTTASVANSATTILNSMTFGELITVAGTGSGAIFADLLMASYNTVAVISSNTQQGGPASRTYSVSSGALRLTMGSATAMSITVQSLISGARGA